MIRYKKFMRGVLSTINNKPATDIVDLSTLPFKQWSYHLSLFLQHSEIEMEIFLRELYYTYQYKKIKHCLKIIEKIPEFPGYPFMTTGNFSDHINYVCHYLGLTQHNKLPNVPIISFNKTASSYINVVLCRLFDVLPIALSYQHNYGIAAWVNSFKRFGGLTHEHYYPTPHNLHLLRHAGIEKIIIHHREPAETMLSFAFHLINLAYHKASNLDVNQKTILVREFIDHNMDDIFQTHATWLNAWRKEAKNLRFEIVETTYSELKADSKAFFHKILAYCDITYNQESLHSIIKEIDQKNDAGYNFRKGDSNEWQDFLTPSQKLKMNRGIERLF